jgi:hypothetical protein
VLDDEIFAKLRVHINTVWRRKNCLLCDNDKWEVHGHVTLGLADKRGSTQLGGAALPCAAVVCTKCGNTILINMVVVDGDGGEGGRPAK